MIQTKYKDECELLKAKLEEVTNERNMLKEVIAKILLESNKMIELLNTKK